MSWTGKKENLDNLTRRDELESMLQTAQATYRLKTYPKNAVVFWVNEPNEYHYYLDEGSLECFRLDATGRKKVIDRYVAGSFFGFHILRDDCMPMSTAQCLENCKIIAIPKDSFFKLLHTCPEFTDRTIRYLFGMLSMQTKEAINSSFYATGQRVAMLLVQLAHEQLTQDGSIEATDTHASFNKTDTRDIVLPYTNNEVANMLGISRNSVTTAMSRLQVQGALEKRRSSIHILDLHTLERIAAME